MFDSAEAMYADHNFLKAVLEWAIASHLTNMKGERLLAATRHAAPGRAPLLERVCSAGHLTQLAAAHVALGRPDPRYDTVDRVVRMGAPLCCRQKRRRNPKMRRPCLLYANKMCAKETNRRAIMKMPPMSKAQKRQCKSTHAATFKTIPTLQQAFYRAAIGHGRRQVQHQSSEPKADDVGNTLDRGFLGQGSVEFPQSPEACKQAVLAHLGWPAEDPRQLDGLPGFTSYSESLRKLAESWSFVEDGGDIPEDNSYMYQRTCWEKHHGFCERDDRDQLPGLKRLKHALHGAIEEGCWVKVKCELRDNSDGVVAYFYAALKRHGSPKISVYAMAELEQSTLTLREASSAFDFQTSAMLAKIMLPSDAEEDRQSEVVRAWATSLVVAPYPNQLMRVRLVSEDVTTQVYAQSREHRPKKDVPPSNPDPEPDNMDAMFKRGLAACNGASRNKDGRDKPGISKMPPHDHRPGAAPHDRDSVQAPRPPSSTSSECGSSNPIDDSSDDGDIIDVGGELSLIHI